MNISLTKIEFVALEMLVKGEPYVWQTYLSRARLAISAVEGLSSMASPAPVDAPAEPEFVPEVDEEAISWQERHGLYKD